MGGPARMAATDTPPPGRPVRSRLAYILSGAALALLVAVAVFSWLVVLPIMQVR